ncbi:hypothetical protein ABEB36_004195 [Hypothenemus hampei]|uniref:Uncharacterized protein n=1 Tax=Hypothenemus hampei TaxID=57062 RepID=A0ABD1F2I9_HYPHA
MANILGGLLWLIVLVTIAFPIAVFCAMWYILFYCLSVCCSACDGITDLMLKGIQLPGFACKKILNCEC